MPSAPTEQSDLRRRGRHRLIGAVTLALVAAVVIPMVLDSEPKRAAAPAELAIPPRDTVAPLPPPEPAPQASVAGVVAAAAPEAAPAPVGSPPAPEAPAVAEPAKPSAAPAKDKVATVTEATPPVVAAPAAAPAAKAEKKAAPALVGFAVQAGAFRDEAKLAQARKKLVDAGLSHYGERIAGQGGELTRLRAGPFPTREAAAAAAAKMKAAGLDAAIVTLP